MTTIHCHIGDRDYRLDYDALRILSGALYHGTVHLDRVLDFYCEIPDEQGNILFFPHEKEQDVRDAVLSAIVEHEHA